MTNDSSPVRGTLPALAALVALAFALRFGVFRPDELGLDGQLSVGLAAIPVQDMLAFNLRDVHPPLFYLALRAWFALVGLNLLAAKWFVVATGILSALLLYQIVQRRFGRPAGVAAAFLLAISPSHIFVSATVRDFAPGLLLSLLSLLLLDRWLEVMDRGSGAPSRLSVALALANGAAMGTWYFHGLFVGVQLVYLLMVGKGARWRGIALVLAGIALCGPWLVIAFPPLAGKALQGVTVSGGERQMVDFMAYAREMTTSLAGSLPLPWEVLFIAYFGLFAAGSIAWFRRGKRVAAVYNLLFALLGLAMVYALACVWVQDLFVTRYFLFALPFLVIGQAALLRHATGRWRQLAAALVIALAVPALCWWWPMLTSSGIPYRENEGYRYLEQNARQGDSIVFTDIARLGYYLLRNSDPLPVYAVHFAGSPFLEDDVAELCQSRLPAVLAKSRRVWLFTSQTGKDSLKAQMEGALGEPYSAPVVFSDPFFYAEISCYPGKAP